MNIKTIDELIEKILEEQISLLQEMDNLSSNNKLEKNLINNLKFISIGLDKALTYVENFRKNNLNTIQIHVGFNTAGSPVYREFQILLIALL